MEDKIKLQPHDKIMARFILPLIPANWLPNHFTAARLLLTPLVVLAIVYERSYLSIFLFFIAAFTDAIDGSLARVRNKITGWGKIFDPLADKLLIGSIVYILVSKYIGFYAALLIISMEVLLIFGGAWRMSQDIIVQANFWSKVKMNLQVFGSLFLLSALPAHNNFLLFISEATFYMAIVFAMVSLFTGGA